MTALRRNRACAHNWPTLCAKRCKPFSCAALFPLLFVCVFLRCSSFRSWEVIAQRTTANSPYVIRRWQANVHDRPFFLLEPVGCNLPIPEIDSLRTCQGIQCVLAVYVFATSVQKLTEQQAILTIPAGCTFYSFTGRPRIRISARVKWTLNLCVLHT